jgi:hypothetical protein
MRQHELSYFYKIIINNLLISEAVVYWTSIEPCTVQYVLCVLGRLNLIKSRYTSLLLLKTFGHFHRLISQHYDSNFVESCWLFDDSWWLILLVDLFRLVIESFAVICALCSFNWRHWTSSLAVVANESVVLHPIEWNRHRLTAFIRDNVGWANRLCSNIWRGEWGGGERRGRWPIEKCVEKHNAVRSYLKEHKRVYAIGALKYILIEYLPSKLHSVVWSKELVLYVMVYFAANQLISFLFKF